MDTEAELNSLRHAKNVWRGIAVGLAATLVLLLAVGAVGGIFLAKRSRMEAMRAEDAMRQAMDEAAKQRQQVEKARMEADEARKAAEKQKRGP